METFRDLLGFDPYFPGDFQGISKGFPGDFPAMAIILF